MLGKTLNSIVVVSAILFSASAAADDHETRKSQTASLVRTLGYGGAIHNFKNYVLRGEARNRDAADEVFQRASTLLAAIQRLDGLNSQEKTAVETVHRIVKQYQAHLPTVGRLHGEGKSVEVIDESVTVDDSAAIAALGTLRKGQKWSEIEDLDFHIGYGGGIHSFKNFVLRADEKYRARASAGLSKVLLILARYRSGQGLEKAELEAIDEIESVVRHYEEALEEVQELIGQGKTASEIDAVVKVDDAPALRGLEKLRAASGATR
jgi:hypothetical protein